MDLGKVESILQGAAHPPYAVMDVLQDIQIAYRYLPDEALCRASEVMQRS